MVSFEAFGIDAALEYGEYLWVRSNNPSRRAIYSEVLGVQI